MHAHTPHAGQYAHSPVGEWWCALLLCVCGLSLGGYVVWLVVVVDLKIDRGIASRARDVIGMRELNFFSGGGWWVG